MADTLQPEPKDIRRTPENPPAVNSPK